MHSKRCAWCGEPFESRRADARFCPHRSRCRVAWSRATRSERLAAEYGLGPNDCWRTPPDAWAYVVREFAPCLDAAAAEGDNLTAAYLSPALDALTVEWWRYLPAKRSERAGLPFAYLNPPYSNGGAERDLLGWVEYAHSQTRDGLGVVALVPPSMSTRYMRHAHNHAHEVRFFARRLSFLHPDTGEATKNNRGDSALLIYRPGAPPQGRADYSYIDI